MYALYGYSVIAVILNSCYTFVYVYWWVESFAVEMIVCGNCTHSIDVCIDKKKKLSGPFLLPYLYETTQITESIYRHPESVPYSWTWSLHRASLGQRSWCCNKTEWMRSFRSLNSEDLHKHTIKKKSWDILMALYIKMKWLNADCWLTFHLLQDSVLIHHCYCHLHSLNRTKTKRCSKCIHVRVL